MIIEQKDPIKQVSHKLDNFIRKIPMLTKVKSTKQDWCEKKREKKINALHNNRIEIACYFVIECPKIYFERQMDDKIL